MSKKRYFHHFGRTAASMIPAAALLVLAGACGGDTEIKTYRVAKEDSHSHESHEHASSAGAPAERPSIPHLHSDVPGGWQEMPPEKMRVASYRIAGKDGAIAEVAVIPLPGVSKIELRSVNLWRQELELAPLTEDQLEANSQPVQVGDTKGLLVDLAASASNTGEKKGTRIIGAVAERSGITWFIKMAGEGALVSQQKDAFTGFLKSLQFHEEAHGTQVAAAEKPVSTNTEKNPASGEKPAFKAPANWAQKAPGPMVTTAYNVNADGGQAEVTISKFPGKAGGMMPNIQRWRGQLGLEALPPDEARKTAEMIEVAGKKEAYLVDLKGTNTKTGKPARMVAVGVPYKGDTWFFKLLGEEAVVGKEKEAFVRFIVDAY